MTFVSRLTGFVVTRCSLEFISGMHRNGCNDRWKVKSIPNDSPHLRTTNSGKRLPRAVDESGGLGDLPLDHPYWKTVGSGSTRSRTVSAGFGDIITAIWPLSGGGGSAKEERSLLTKQSIVIDQKEIGMMLDLELQFIFFAGITLLLIAGISFLIYLMRRFRQQDDEFLREHAEALRYIRPPSIEDDPLPKYVANSPEDQIRQRLAHRAENNFSVLHWLGVHSPSYRTRTDYDAASTNGSVTSSEDNLPLHHVQQHLVNGGDFGVRPSLEDASHVSDERELDRMSIPSVPAISDVNISIEIIESSGSRSMDVSSLTKLSSKG
ncbi:hypothetical protein HDU98_007536 [Podochytrium sp. JEL0797]|nr:hypothetical protein HDU98_007536 [Podochytrium sp. JEL0797]